VSVFRQVSGVSPGTATTTASYGIMAADTVSIDVTPP
jgi:hypothetical protein